MQFQAGLDRVVESINHRQQRCPWQAVKGHLMLPIQADVDQSSQPAFNHHTAAGQVAHQ